MYTIGRLARRARVNADSIRFYERQGLLAADSKTDSGYRLYSDDALRRIVFIKHAQKCGFSLAEIGHLLQMQFGSTAERQEAYDLLRNKQGEIDATIELLQCMSAALKSVLSSAPSDSPDGLPGRDTPLVATLEARLSDGREDARRRRGLAGPQHSGQSVAA